ncbi:MAG: SLC13 family permease, partial [Campylobacterota bacterium]
MEQLFVAFSLLALLALLVQNRFDPALVFTGVAGSYYLFGLLEFGQWAGNYVNNSLLTLALLLILSLAIEKTTFVKDLSNRLITPGYYASLLRLGFFTSAVSAFLNNTAVVASLIATIKSNAYHKPSKLLIPLSYSAIFGGTMTLIGTSTNLIVNSFAIKEGLPSLQIFDFFLVGAAITVFGILALLFASRFLPSYENKQTKPKDWFIETRVAKNCSLVGKSVEENGLRNLKEIFLVEIKRDGHFLAPVSPKEIIYEDDVLIFSGDIAQIEILKRFKGLNLTDEKMDLGSNLVEVIISNESSLIGQQVKDSNFRSKFDAAIVAMKSGGEDVSAIGSATLQVGDTLVLAVGSDFYGRDNIAKNFHILSNINKSKSLTKSQSAVVLGSFLCAVLTGAFGFLSLFKALLIVLALYLAAGFLRMGEIKRRFPYQIVLIVGSALSVAAVMID